MEDSPVAFYATVQDEGGGKLKEALKDRIQKSNDSRPNPNRISGRE
jgi:hypothetical protein